MLPLRPNKKPQLLPIKQLLLKQKDETSRAEDDQNLNTDEYLLWKSENEPSGRKSVSFSTRKNESHLRSQDTEFNDNSAFIRNQRSRNELFVEDTLWDSDEQDDSLRDHLNSLNRIKSYSFEDSPKQLDKPGYRLNENPVKLRKQKNSESSSHWRKNHDTNNKKLIEAVSLTIKEAIEDAEQNLSSQLELKIIDEISNLKKLFKFDILQNEVNGKFEKISQSLGSLRENYHSELENLRSDLTQQIDNIPTKCKSDDGFKEAGEKMHSIFLESLTAAEKNFEKAVKAIDFSCQKETNESYVQQYDAIFNKNLKKMEELNEKVESLTQATNNVLQLITDLKQARSETSSNETSRKIIRTEIPLLNINDIKSDAFYMNIDEELDRYRQAFNKSCNSNGHQETKSAWLATIDERWRTLGVL